SLQICWNIWGWVLIIGHTSLIQLIQSVAISGNIAEGHGMVPDFKKQRAVLHMLQYEVMDLRSAFTRICYSPDFANGGAGGTPNGMDVAILNDSQLTALL
ncbi:Glutathione S-transferase class-mu 26 kDa isozyme 51, partial [Taenia solium]